MSKMVYLSLQKEVTTLAWRLLLFCYDIILHFIPYGIVDYTISVHACMVGRAERMGSRWGY